MAKEEFRDMECGLNADNIVWLTFLNLVQSNTDKSDETKAEISKHYNSLQEKTDDELELELKYTQPGYKSPESPLYGEKLSLYSTCIRILIDLRQ